MKLTAGGFVHPSSGQALSYGDLVGDARGLSLSQVKPRDPSSWRQAGRRAARLDNRIKATGVPIYGIDVNVPGMVCAWVLHAPRPGSRTRVDNERGLLALSAARSGCGHSRPGR